MIAFDKYIYFFFTVDKIAKYKSDFGIEKYNGSIAGLNAFNC